MGCQARMKLQARVKGAAGPKHLRRRRHWVVAAVLGVLVVAGGVGGWQWNEARIPPEPAPRFNLMASTGQVITLDDYLGKQEVVLIFYMGAG